MAGYYKSSRVLGKPQRAEFSLSAPWAPKTKYSGDIVIPGDQTTTSFRSSGKESELVAPPQESIFKMDFPSGDTGHPFDTVKRTVKGSTSLVQAGTSPGGITSIGYAPAILTEYNDTPEGTNRNFPVVEPMTQSYINRMGSEMILSATPTASSSNLTLALSELLKDGLPDFGQSLLGKKDRWGNTVDIPNLKGGKFYSGAFINFQFAIKPLLSDIEDLLNTVRDAPYILAQLRRDSGKVVRRRRFLNLPDDFSTRFARANEGAVFLGRTTRSESLPLATFHLGTSPTGDLEIADRVSTSVVFTGGFQYYLDVGDDALSKLSSFASQADHLLGLKVTPEVLWNLAPWSWLADWFANIGTILGNVSNFQEDGLVLKYGYLMRHTVATRYISYTAPRGSINPGKTYITRYRTERKERAQATPYGFGMSDGDLSIRQWGILAALAEMRAEGSSGRR